MITLVILVKKHSDRLKRHLEQYSKYVDEIVLINNNLNKKLKDFENFFYGVVKVYFVKSLDFSFLRNFAISKAKKEWILFLDDDETIGPNDFKKIFERIKNTDKIAFYIKRREFFLQKEVKFGEVLKLRFKGVIRLIKKGGGEWVGKVHEVFVPRGEIGNLSVEIYHFSHASVTSFLKKINFYSTLRARDIYLQGKSFNFLETVLFPFLKFIYTYFFLFGFLDGYRGFIYSFLMSFHSFLVRAKLYQYRDFER